jgi:hypothetical protein
MSTARKFPNDNISLRIIHIWERRALLNFEYDRIVLSEDTQKSTT